MRNVLVSGGTRGVGLAVARKLVKDGFSVFAIGRKEGEALNGAVAELPAGQYRELHARADVGLRRDQLPTLALELADEKERDRALAAVFQLELQPCG